MKMISLRLLGFTACMGAFLIASSAEAGLLDRLRRHRGEGDSQQQAQQNNEALTFEDRTMVVHVPERLPAQGQRALVIVLHGGMGNAERIASEQSEKGLKLDEAADKYGFIVAYLNGTKVSHVFGESRKGWNAGDCCGVPSQQKVDDVAYITRAVADLREQYGVDARRVYGIGHSNGAMMTMRLICETDVLAAAMPVSGTLESDPAACTHARGKPVLALLGSQDTNVPYAGGKGNGLSKTAYTSQDFTKEQFLNAGANYHLQLLDGAEHKFETIEKVIEATEGITFAEKAARFFGLAH